MRIDESYSPQLVIQPTPNTASEPCWKLAKGWLSNCLNDHPKCSQLSSARAYHPTRIIEVRQLTSDPDAKLHLRVAGEHSPDAPYVTLSHCWGNKEFFRLTKATFQRLRDGISAGTLPKTFQDAVIICRKLNVRYLWIDALCIFQDSLRDWQEEGAKMDLIYQNSFCNIAATAASNGEEGCFRDRDPSVVLGRLRITTQYTNKINQDYEVLPPEIWQYSIDNAPLNRRGWVLQEHLLAPRNLHYASNQLFWECRELDACERFPRGLSGHLRLKSYILDVDTAQRCLENRSKSELLAPAYASASWGIIIEAYMRANLTKPEDKLVALSGIAKRMQKSLGDERGASLTKPNIYRAPSWSWASVDGEIMSGYEESDYEVLITVVAVHVVPVTADRTGQIKDGFLRLKRDIIPTKPWELVERSLAQPYDRLNFDGGDQNLRTDIPPQKDGRDFYCLPIRTLIYGGERLFIPDLEGLILEPAAQSKGVYERVGYFRSHVSERSLKLVSRDDSLYENAEEKTLILI